MVRSFINTPVTWAALLILAVSISAIADTVHRRNGTKVDGKIVEETDEHVIIDTKFGSLTIARDEILRIEKGKTPIDQFRDEWAEVDRTDTLALLDLADWCRENRLSREARKCWREVLKTESDNESARRALGYVLVDGNWMTKKEVAAAEKAREKEERSRSKESASEKKSGSSPGKGVNPLETLGDVSADTEPFLSVIPDNQGEDEKTAVELEDFFGQKFSVGTSEHFSMRLQLPMPEVHQHLALAERLFVQCNKIFSESPDYRLWPDQYRMFLVKQKGAYTDLVDWIDENISEIDADSKVFFKEGGGMSMSNPPIVANVERETPFERAIAHYVGQTYIAWLSRGFARPWLREGFAAYTAVGEFGANEIYCSTNTKYANNVEVADKDTDGAYKLICIDIVDNALDEPHPFARGSENGTESLGIADKTLNQLDYADLAKSWSVVDFLLRFHPEKFKEFVTSLPRYEGDSVVTLKQVFGWTPQELDEKWADFVRGNYSNEAVGSK